MLEHDGDQGLRVDAELVAAEESVQSAAGHCVEGGPIFLSCGDALLSEGITCDGHVRAEFWKDAHDGTLHWHELRDEVVGILHQGQLDQIQIVFQELDRILMAVGPGQELVDPACPPKCEEMNWEPTNKGLGYLLCRFTLTSKMAVLCPWGYSPIKSACTRMHRMVYSSKVQHSILDLTQLCVRCSFLH